MNHYGKADLESMDRISRLKLVNALSGVKPANLVGTVSDRGDTNLAIFSSVVHLGSNPALMGMILRPTGEVPRHTYENILATGVYTVNHVHHSFTERAHYTSAKFPASISEFSRCGLTEEYHPEFAAPFVAESPLRMGLEYRESIPIELNGTIMVIGEVVHVFCPEAAMEDNGHLNLEKLGVVGISGLNSYYDLRQVAVYPYARVADVPDFAQH